MSKYLVVMKKIISVVSIFLAIGFVLSSLYSFVVIFKPAEYRASTKPSKDKIVSKRIDKLAYAVSPTYIDEYNHLWLCLNLKNPNIDCYQKNYTRINQDFYKQHNASILLDLKYLSLFNKQSQLYKEKLEQYITYLTKKKISIVGVQAISMYSDSYIDVPTFKYGKDNDADISFLLQQLSIAEKVASISSQRQFLNFIIEITQPIIQNYNSEIFINNIASAFKEHIKQNPNTRIRLLIKNGAPKEILTNQSTCSFSGLAVKDMVQSRQSIIRSLQQSVNITNVPDRVALAIDMSALITVWQTSKCNTYKDIYGNSISDNDFIETIFKELPPENILSLKALFASYNLLGENNIGKYNSTSTSYLPYSRANTDFFLNRQLSLLTKLYEASGIGRVDDSGMIIIDTPLGRMYPIFYTFGSFIVDRLNFYFKKEGANLDEVSYSLKLVQHSLFSIR